MEQQIYSYIEIKELETGKVIQRLDVSDKSQKTIEKAEMGMNINLNHQKYYTFSFDSEYKLDEIPCSTT
jgi:hypothetical protein